MVSSGDTVGVVDRQSERAEREPDAGDVHLALRAQSRGDHDAEEQQGQAGFRRSSGGRAVLTGRRACLAKPTFAG